MSSSADVSDAEDESEQEPPMPFNDPLQEHTESSPPSRVPSSVKASRSGSPALDSAKMQKMYEEHKRWIIAGELERLVTAQVFSFFPFFSFHPTLVRCVRVRNLSVDVRVRAS